MTVDHHKLDLTDGEVAWLMQTRHLAPQEGSPLVAFAEVTADADQASLTERGASDPAWDAAFAALAAPDRQVRLIVPNPSETLVQVYYGSRSHPEAGLVGYWIEGDRLRVSFPWEEEDIAAATSRVVLRTAPPLGGSGKLSLSINGLAVLAGTVDAVRERLFTSLSGRDPAIRDRFDRDDLERQITAGEQSSDARWFVTLLRILAPHSAVAGDGAVDAGLSELAAAGMVRTDDGQWAPELPLLNLATQLRNPLPAVAHEVIETADGQVWRYDHRITIRGDGPLELLDYEDLLSGQPTVSVTSIDVVDYVDGLIELLKPGTSSAAGEWFYVLDPVEVRDLHDTAAVAATLQPGSWYLKGSEEGDWARVADANGSFEGWAPAAKLHGQAEPPEVAASSPAQVSTPAWTADHVVPADGAPVWATPDPATTDIGTLPGGTGVRTLETLGAWTRVQSESGTDGWVDGRRLAAVTAPEPEPWGSAAADTPTPAGAAATATATATATNPVDAVVATARSKPIQLAAALALVVSAFLPWFSDFASSFDLPVAFLWSLEPDESSVSIGLLILFVGIGALATVLVAQLNRYQRIAGGIATGIATIWLIQTFRTLLEWRDGAFGTVVADMSTEVLSFGPWVALAAGITLLVKR